MADWPASLPQEQFLGLTIQRQDARLRTQTDAGRPKVRRRFTAATTKVRVPIVLTGAQKQAFDTFYQTTLQEGSLPFTWEHPVTDAAVSIIFGQEPPTFQLILGGTTDTRVYTGSLDLEILP